ncbi:MAG: hypothetical protein ACLSVD_09050 [Eggerthellaceae bacterium]
MAGSTKVLRSTRRVCRRSPRTTASSSPARTSSAGGAGQLAGGAGELSSGMNQLNASTITLPETMKRQIADMTAGFDFRVRPGVVRVAAERQRGSRAVRHDHGRHRAA